MDNFFQMCKNNNDDKNDKIRYLKVKNIFKNKNEKFEDSLKTKYGIIFIYDNTNFLNIINIFQKIEKDSKLCKQIKESYTVKVYDFNEKEKYEKYIGFITEITESIFLIKKEKEKKYIPKKFDLNYKQLKDIIDSFMKKKEKNNNSTLNISKNLKFDDLEKKKNIINQNISMYELKNNEQCNISEKINFTQNININELNNYNINNNNEIKNDYNNIDLYQSYNYNSNNNETKKKSNNQRIKEKNQERNDKKKKYTYNNAEKDTNTMHESNLQKTNLLQISNLQINDLNKFNYNQENDFENNYNIKSDRQLLKNNLFDNEIINLDKNENKILKNELSKEPKEGDNITTIIFKYPSNKIIKRNFNKDDKIKLMYIYINTLSDDIFKELKQKNFLLCQPFPKKIYSNKEDTFFDAGLYPDGVINIIPDDKNNY